MTIDMSNIEVGDKLLLRNGETDVVLRVEVEDTNEYTYKIYLEEDGYNAYTDTGAWRSEGEKSDWDIMQHFPKEASDTLSNDTVAVGDTIITFGGYSFDGKEGVVTRVEGDTTIRFTVASYAGGSHSWIGIKDEYKIIKKGVDKVSEPDIINKVKGDTIATHTLKPWDGTYHLADAMRYAFDPFLEDKQQLTTIEKSLEGIRYDN